MDGKMKSIVGKDLNGCQLWKRGICHFILEAETGRA